MELRRRVGYPRSYFHVMNRGARKVGIFADDTDRRIFRGLLGRFADKHGVKLLAWCLMPNHYHLQPDCEGTPLSLMMRDLDRTYARSFNERHRTTGCLFQGPFKSMEVTDMEGVTYVNRYIHLNPVDLGRPPEGYGWSSCGSYLGISPVPSWMDLEPVMNALRTPDRSDAESYAYYLQQGFQRRKRRPKKSKDPLSGFYTEWVRHLEERCIEKLTGREDALGKLAMTALVCWLAHRVYNVPGHVVAGFYGYGSAAAVRVICARVQERIEEDPQLQELLRSVNVLTTLAR
jgi:putative transposase